MKKLSPERRRLAAFAGACAALNSSGLLLFQHMPKTPIYEALYGLMVGVPLSITIILFIRLRRRGLCSDSENA